MKKLVSCARPLCVAAPFLLAVVASASFAQDPRFELQPVTVTGSGIPRTLGSSIAATSVLTRRDIERAGARDAVSVLNLLGTALVEQQGGAGTLAAVRIRGADSRDTLVLVDGVPLTDLTSGQALIQQIPADIIERVEVVRGNLSALYGANATGGVIQFFTRRGTAGGFAPQADVGAGSRGTRAANASLAGGAAAWSARVAVGSERTDGFSAGNTANANPDDDGNRRGHATVAADLQWGAGHSIGADLRHIDGRAEYDAPLFGAPTDTHEQRLVQSGGSLRGRHLLSPRWTLAWRWGDSKEARRDTEVSAFGGVRENTLRNDIKALELSASMATGLVAQLAVERLEQSTTSRSHSRAQRDTDVVRIGANYDDEALSLQANLRHDRTTDFGSASTGLVGASWRLSEPLRLVASASTSFTPPTFDFLFFDCGPGFVCSNPNLRPERARNVEAGLQWQSARTLLRATLFAARYTDKIANDENFVPQNIARMRNEGLELSARHALDAWTVLAEATLQNPKDEATGERPIRRAREQLALRADWQRARWQAGAGWRLVGDRRDAGGTLPSYALVDVSARFRLASAWSVFGSVDNLFDRRYEPTVGYNGRPRAVFVGLSWLPQD